MNCPMIQPKLELEHGEEFVRLARCTEEECAWWDKVLEQCIAISIGDWLENIHSILSGMLDKMPHEEQFRK